MIKDGAFGWWLTGWSITVAGVEQIDNPTAQPMSTSYVPSDVIAYTYDPAAAARWRRFGKLDQGMTVVAYETPCASPSP